MDGREVSVAFPEDQAVAMRDAVAAGEYATTSDIVREARHRRSCPAIVCAA
jgi:Arc/MetJ-type ribon-helix-helix transcriptional regulator